MSTEDTQDRVADEDLTFYDYSHAVLVGIVFECSGGHLELDLLLRFSTSESIGNHRAFHIVGF